MRNFLPAFSITRKSRLSHKFDFVFPSKGISKIAEVHNTVNKQQVDNILANWLDTVEFRQVEYSDKEQLYIIVNDNVYKDIKEEHMLALKKYNIEVINFFDKVQLQKKLSL